MALQPHVCKLEMLEWRGITRTITVAQSIAACRLKTTAIMLMQPLSAAFSLAYDYYKAAVL
jgi:hypothetical protein